jgi:hypothetical protein
VKEIDHLMDSTLTLASTLTVPEDVLYQELHGEGVLLNLKTGVYFGLDAVGRRMFELIQAKGTLQPVLDTMLAEYDVTQEQCVTDLLTLVTEMEKHGLVVRTPA